MTKINKIPEKFGRVKILLITGLGNPGKKYEHTRHNIGFRVLDALADKFSAVFIDEVKFKSQTSAFDHQTTRVILAKPQTFMNDSGTAVAALKNFFKIQNDHLLIVHDEMDLPIGTIRISKDSGPAGHNGVGSVIENVGRDFTRLRIGIENRQGRRTPPTDAYVLEKFTEEEEAKLQKEIIPQAIEQIEKILNFELPARNDSRLV